MIDLEQSIFDAVTLIHLLSEQLAVKLENEYPRQGGGYASGLISIAHQTENRLTEACERLRAERKQEAAANDVQVQRGQSLPTSAPRQRKGGKGRP